MRYNRGMNVWHGIGIVVSPLKHTVFWMVSRVHRTTRPRVAIICGDEVLAVRHWGDRKWALPGGGVHRGEAHEVTVARECQEELGVTIPPEELELSITMEMKLYTAPVYIWKIDKKPSLTLQKLEITGAKWLSKRVIALHPTEVNTTVSALIF